MMEYSINSNVNQNLNYYLCVTPMKAGMTVVYLSLLNDEVYTISI